MGRRGEHGGGSSPGARSSSSPGLRAAGWQLVCCLPRLRFPKAQTPCPEGGWGSTGQRVPRYHQSLWCDLCSLGPDEGDEILVDEEDEPQAGDLQRGGQRWHGAQAPCPAPHAPGSACLPPLLTSTTELLLRRHLEPHSTGRPSM